MKHITVNNIEKKLRETSDLNGVSRESDFLNAFNIKRCTPRFNLQRKAVALAILSKMASIGMVEVTPDGVRRVK